jgi:hypothetical protein
MSGEADELDSVASSSAVSSQYADAKPPACKGSSATCSFIEIIFETTIDGLMPATVTSHAINDVFLPRRRYYERLSHYL